MQRSHDASTAAANAAGTAGHGAAGQPRSGGDTDRQRGGGDGVDTHVAKTTTLRRGIDGHAAGSAHHPAGDDAGGRPATGIEPARGEDTGDDDDDGDDAGSGGVRVDKWLWAARFFRTRARAKDAIVNGRVQVDGARCKPSRTLAKGQRVEVRRGDERFTVVVLRTDDERRSAPRAQALYAETADSRERRAREAALRASAAQVHSAGRPTKRDRRAFARLREARAEADGDDA
jgi:ribosome-associated heat shock protein Hsp15